MAIEIQKEGEKTKITLDNGHASALEKIVKDYNLLGEKEALSFILSVLSEADGKPIDNGKGKFVPSDKLRKDTQKDA